MLRKILGLILGLAVALVLVVVPMVACGSGSPTASNNPNDPKNLSPNVETVLDYRRIVNDENRVAFRTFEDDIPTLRIRPFSDDDSIEIVVGEVTRTDVRNFTVSVSIEGIPEHGLRVEVWAADRARARKDEDGEWIRGSHIVGFEFTICGRRIPEDALIKHRESTTSDITINRGCTFTF